MASKFSERKWAQSGARNPDDFQEEGQPPNEAVAAPMAAPEDQVRSRAYEIWEQQGCPDGCEQEHWLQAEGEIAQPSRSG